MESTNSFLDDGNPNFFPYFLESSVEPAFTSMSSPGVLPDLGEFQRGWDDYLEELEAPSSGQSTQYDQEALNSWENHGNLLGIGDQNSVSNDFLGLGGQIPSEPDLTVPQEEPAHVGLDGPGFSHQYPTREQLGVEAELPSPFNMDHVGDPNIAGDWSPQDNLDDPSSDSPNPRAPTDDDPTWTLSQDPPMDEVHNELPGRRERHPRMPGGYPCDLCPRKFDLRRDLTRHRRQHTSSITCDRCRATFTSKKDLDRHVSSVHDRRKKYICHVCNKGFSRKDNMLRHCRKVHCEDILLGGNA